MTEPVKMDAPTDCITRTAGANPKHAIDMKETTLTFAEIISGARLIPLTKGKFAIVDSEDYERIASLGKWCVSHYGYAVRRTPMMNGRKGEIIYMHRVIIGTGKGLDTDHVNRNGLDNRKDNLRACSHSENLRNRPKQLNNSSGFKGVRFCKRDKKWFASIKLHGVTYGFPRRPTPEEASADYVAAAKRLHGEFARTA